VSFDFVIVGVGGQPIDRMVEIFSAACAEAEIIALSTAPRGVMQLGGSRLAQLSLGECWSSIVTEDTGGFLLALEAGEAFRYAKYCARDGIALVDTLVVPPESPRDPRPYPKIEALESAMKEVIAGVHFEDFRAMARKGGSAPEFAYAAMLGAASRMRGFEPLVGQWEAGLAAAHAPEGETKAFLAGAAWGREGKPSK